MPRHKKNEKSALHDLLSPSPGGTEDSLSGAVDLFTASVPITRATGVAVFGADDEEDFVPAPASEQSAASAPASLATEAASKTAGNPPESTPAALEIPSAVSGERQRVLGRQSSREHTSCAG